jgi:hypothetical protein
MQEGKMASATARVLQHNPAQLDDRRLAIENAIGTMRIENLEPDETTIQILARYASGEIELSETNRLLDEHSRIVTSNHAAASLTHFGP